jgi:hypothetical protein
MAGYSHLASAESAHLRLDYFAEIESVTSVWRWTFGAMTPAREVRRLEDVPIVLSFPPETQALKQFFDAG